LVWFWKSFDENVIKVQALFFIWSGVGDVFFDENLKQGAIAKYCQGSHNQRFSWFAKTSQKMSNSFLIVIIDSLLILVNL
jgi:hypothetical protein